MLKSTYFCAFTAGTVPFSSCSITIHISCNTGNAKNYSRWYSASPPPLPGWPGYNREIKTPSKPSRGGDGGVAVRREKEKDREKPVYSASHLITPSGGGDGRVSGLARRK